MSIRIGLLIPCTFFFVGCLQTRSDVREGEHRQVLQTQVSTLQKSTADVSNRFEEVEEQIRFLNGRIEVLENKLASAHAENEQLRRISQDAVQNQNQRFQVFQEALSKMDQEQEVLKAELANLRSQQAEQAKVVPAAAAAAAPKANNGYELGEQLFEKKEFRQAILEYQRYREKFPKGKSFASATYKIGVSFQELGLRDEARSFYEEVISKFPKSEEARKSKARLQKLK
ncbi:MAG: tetratricopeptide repeat protein [Bdellovibrionales bacterium]